MNKNKKIIKDDPRECFAAEIICQEFSDEVCKRAEEYDGTISFSPVACNLPSELWFYAEFKCSDDKEHFLSKIWDVIHPQRKVS